MIRIPLVFGLLAAITACSERSPTGAAGTLELTVSSDRSVYSLATDSGAEPILINRGSVRVYLPMNEYVFVQRFDVGAWSVPQPWFSVDGIGVSFSLEPGDTLRSGSMDFRYVDRAPGVYRFVFEIATDPNGRRRLPEALRVSPPFELTQ